MPIKMMVMVRRRPGLSPEEFRRGYEESHVRIAVELFGHLWSEYRRNYLIAGHSFAIGTGGGEHGGPDEIGYDAVSEFILPDAAALDEMRRIGMANQVRIQEDEAKWFDRARCWAVACETIEEDLAAHRERRMHAVAIEDVDAIV